MERSLTEIAETEDAKERIEGLLTAGIVKTAGQGSEAETYLDDDAAAELKGHAALKGIDLKKTPVNAVVDALVKRQQRSIIQRDRHTAATVAEKSRLGLQSLAGSLLAHGGAATPPPATLSSVTAQPRSFRVPLSVGAIRPPIVGDLLLVEQQLRCYEMGELADIQSIMLGESRERNMRSLSRTRQSTTSETSSEREQSEDLRTDERFQLSAEARKAASKEFSIDAGVSVSGKYGPVEVGASTNASFSTSKSSSESSSQEFAKSVSQQATTRVRDSIKESSSVTFLNETQQTSLQGFNNQEGTGHVNGLYRWVDKVYSARLLNYGRRFMLEFAIPEPAAFFRGIISNNERELTKDLREPVHPTDVVIRTVSREPVIPRNKKFASYRDIDAKNYAGLAALYDVVDVFPPPAPKITGAKAIAYPEAMTAAKVTEHNAARKELSYVAADNSLTIDADYKLGRVGVYAPRKPSGETDAHEWYADALKLGEHGNDENSILVQVGVKSFHFRATGGNPKNIDTNFNTTEVVEGGDLLAGVLQPSLPITISCDFEGIFSLTVIYTAFLRDAALDRWKSDTYAAILKGYERKKRQYDQAVQLAKSKAAAEVETKTYQLRDQQYRAIELTEIKRGCVELLTEGTASGYSPLAINADGLPPVIEFDSGTDANWRSPLANGAVANFFEEAFEWEQATYQFHPYYWTARDRWRDLMEIAGGDPVFEQFLKAGSARTVVPVRPGYERTMAFFLKTGLIWGGGYLPLFSARDMLEVYNDAEKGLQLDPPRQVGPSWDIRVPTNLVIIQPDDVLPEFEVESDANNESDVVDNEPIPGEPAPF